MTNYKKLLLAAVAILFTASPIMAEDEVVNISSIAELQKLAALCNDGSKSDETIGRTYKLTTDLDLSSVTNWTPIGGLDGYPGTAFKGTFDGDGHIIKNLTCEDTHAKYATAALFGAVSNGATIKNLTLENVNIHSTHYAAAFVAYEGAETKPVKFENCHVKGGKIVSTPELVDGEYDNGDKVGALIGYTVWTEIKDCTVEGVTLQGYRDIGGLAGLINNAGTSTVTKNSVSGITLVQDNTNGYKTNSDGSLQDMSSTVGEVVGGRSNSTVKDQANDDKQNTVGENVKTETVKWGIAKYDETYFVSLSAAINAAVAAGDKNIVVSLINDATLDITARSNVLWIGGDDTETITINGNGKTLNFNKKNKDWNDVSTKNDAKTKLVLNDMTLTDSGYNNGPWNRYDINFSCDVTLNNVVSNKALAFKNAATLNNVTVNEDGKANNSSNYAIWIQPKGQNISINGLTINADYSFVTKDSKGNEQTQTGRGIKIDNQYNEETAGPVVLNISNATFNTASKSAILVKNPTATTTITAGENINIEGVKADQTNLVWVDEDAVSRYDGVTVNGTAVVVPEGGVKEFTFTRTTNGKVNGYYKAKNFTKAITDFEDGQSINLADDFTLTANVNVTKNLTLTLGDYTLTPATYHLLLATNVGVTTDKVAATLFAAATEGDVIRQATAENGYTYNAVTPEKGEVNPEQTIIILGEAGMATFASTDDVDFSAWTGIKAYVAQGIEDGQLVLWRVMHLAAGEGALLVGSEGAIESVAKATTTDISNYYDNLFIGVTTETLITGKEGDYTNFVLGQPTGHDWGFYKSQDGNLAAGKAYLHLLTTEVPSTGSGARGLGMRFIDETSGISDATRLVNSEKVNSGVYDLQGRRVAQPQKGRLYIVGGKKVVY